jgi:hypothetical protein
VVGGPQGEAGPAFVNWELVQLYWQIGQAFVAKQQGVRWVKAVVERLAADIQAAFPGISGFSP